MFENLEQKKGNYIVFLVISVLFLLFLLNEAKKEITGLYTWATLNVSVKSITKIKITAFDYQPYLYLGDSTNITVEVENSGSTTYNEKIEIFIKNSTLDQLAYYYDALTKLNPGNRKSFGIVYLPSDYGTYYIQVRVSYADTRKTETWGIFFVREIPPVIVNPGQPGQPGQPSETWGSGEAGYVSSIESHAIKGAPAKKPPINYIIDIECPDVLDISKEKTSVAYIKVKNLGNTSLHSIKITTETEANISVDIFPKSLMELPSKESSVFMLSVNVPLNIEPNLYLLNFEVSSNEVSKKGKMTLNVTEFSLKDLVYQIILNYKFIIVEIENQINDASENGIKISEIQTELEKIKIDISGAEDYYNRGYYGDAYQKLQEIRVNIQNLLLAFAIINIPKVVFFNASNIIKILGLLLLIILLVILYLYKKSREQLKRPKLLRESSEEAGNSFN